MWSWLKCAGLAVLAAGWLIAGAPAPANAFEAITGDGGGTDVPSSSSSGGTGASAGSGGDPDTQLAEAAQRLEQAVGLVVVSGPFGPHPTGTAWALQPNVFVTNAHVVKGVKRALASPFFDAAFVAINKRPDLQLRIRGMSAHARHGEVQRDLAGELSIGHAFDVGLIRTDGQAPSVFQVASTAELQALRAGQRVAYLGFPTENLLKGNVNPLHPVATMQSGIITSVTDYWQKQQDPAKSYFVRHNMGAAGGASGSPIFNPEGKIVAVLSGGNLFAGVTKTSNGIDIKRVGNAAMINFAQRADLIDDLLR
jgi:V8-like Glu-specific endopeptidase